MQIRAGGTITISLGLADLSGGTVRILLFGPSDTEPLEVCSFELG